MENGSLLSVSLGKCVVIKYYVDDNHAGNIKIGGHILELLSISMIPISFGTLNFRIKLRLQVLGRSILHLGLRQR